MIGYRAVDARAPWREPMSDEAGGIRSRGEEALGELAQSLLENPLLSQALGKALGVGERAAGAQRAALQAIDIPTAGDVERLARRVRALGDRLDALEEEVDRLRRQASTSNRDTAGSPP
ncbi:MAG: hypothetical protein BroJett022_12770 [Actinomycetes bacterium]|nr:MAG: hypothetical protein BroJett022_12770 [Actinomycetes bacterium]